MPPCVGSPTSPTADDAALAGALIGERHVGVEQQRMTSAAHRHTSGQHAAARRREVRNELLERSRIDAGEAQVGVVDGDRVGRA